MRETMRERERQWERRWERERESEGDSKIERERESEGDSKRESESEREIQRERESNKSIIILGTIKYNYTSVPGNISEIGVIRSSNIILLCFLQQNKIDFSNGRGNFNVL